MIFRRAVVAVLLVVAAVGFAGRPAFAASCAAPAPSTTQPGYLVADPACDISGARFAMGRSMIDTVRNSLGSAVR